MDKREAFRAVQSVTRGVTRAGLDIILPPQDPFSKSDQDWEDIQYLDEPCCDTCGFPFEYAVGKGALCAGCLARPPRYISARAAFIYNDASRDIILSFKHGGRTENLSRFAAQLRRAGRGFLSDADLIVPVPLHRTRRIKRRYNQSVLLGRALSRITNASFEPNSLRRIRATASQGGQSAAGRKRNVQGAFAVEERAKERLEGANVVLIDDVMTTGATLDACASVLLRSGANRVDALCLARVIREQQSQNGSQNEDRQNKDALDGKS